MSTVVYVAIVEGSEKEGYSAFFPDLPGCVTASDSMVELIADARDVLGLHLEGMLEDGLELPAPSALEAIPQDPDVSEAGRLLVDAEIDDAPVRVNISIGAGLLKRVDTAAQVRGMSRSGLLAEAVRQFMSAPADSPSSVGVQEADVKFDHPFDGGRYLIVPTEDDALGVIWDRLTEQVIDVVEMTPHRIRTHDFDGTIIRFPDPAAIRSRRVA